jgi:hypothetical protein
VIFIYGFKRDKERLKEAKKLLIQYRLSTFKRTYQLFPTD